MADAVAILDHGRVVRVGATEDVQRDVKRVVLSHMALVQRPRPAKLLDVKKDAARIAVTLDDCGPWIAGLRADGVEHVVEDLSLDEIFEAFVIGRVDGWPDPPAALNAAVA